MKVTLLANHSLSSSPRRRKSPSPPYLCHDSNDSKNQLKLFHYQKEIKVQYFWDSLDSLHQNIVQTDCNGNTATLTNRIQNQNFQMELIQYSERIISEPTSVETGTNILPFNIPLTVVSLPSDLSLENYRFFCPRKPSPSLTTQYIVYQMGDAPTDLMIDFGMDEFQLIWRDNSGLPQLHRLIFQAKTMAAVLMIRCATQNSTFPLEGQFLPDLALGKRVFDPDLYKISPAKYRFQEYADSHQERFQTATEIFIRINNSHNVYHKRTDLRDYIVNNPLHFETLKCERCSAELKARGQKYDNIWDDWDGLLASVSDAESCTWDHYGAELSKFVEMSDKVY